MADSPVLPFRGLLYNPEKITDLSRVVTPPYDVISPEQQNQFYDKSPYNFVRVDFGQEAGDEKYSAAQKLYGEWIQKGILIQDAEPSFYIHHQTFTLSDGRTFTRKGFFGIRRIEDFSEGGVKPHEKTLEGPKADRLKLTRATQANLSPVFSLYSDPDKLVDTQVATLVKNPALFDFKTEDGQRHQLWKVSDPSIVESISLTLVDRPLFIADGHHRYETAINYRNECRGRNPKYTGSEPFNYVLMYFSNMNDPGLVILPIHRALHSLKDFKVEEFVALMAEEFFVTTLNVSKPDEITAALSAAGEGAHAFALLSKDPDKVYILSLAHEKWKKSEMASRLSPSLVNLDVTVLHKIIFEKVLGMTPEAQANQENIIYWKETEKAIAETRKGTCQVTFLLNPTRIEDMAAVANAGEKMPQKSTFFYPKVLSGLVIHSLKSL